MINPELIGYLRLTVSPEAGDVYSNAYNVLTQTGSIEHEFAIMQTIGMADQDDTATSIAYIENILSESLANKLGDHGIEVSETNIRLMTHLLEACASIDSYGDPESIYNICVDDATPELKLCEIMEFFSPYLWTDYFGLITSVSPDLITSITALLKERAELTMEQTDTVELQLPITDIRSRTLKYVDGKPDLQVLRLVKEGMPLGLDMELYVQSCRDVLETMAVPRLVSELTAIAHASNLLREDLVTAIREQIASIHGNVNTLTQASIVLSKEAFHE